MSEIRRVRLDSISERWQRSPRAAGVSDPLEQDQEVAGECERLKLTGERYRAHFKHKNFICRETEHRVVCRSLSSVSSSLISLRSGSKSERLIIGAGRSGPGFVGFKYLGNKIFNPIADRSDRVLR